MTTIERRMRRLAFVLLAGAVSCALYAGYAYSFCVPLESSCHMGEASSCVRLAETLRRSAWTGAVAVALAVVGAVFGVIAKRARDGARA